MESCSRPPFRRTERAGGGGVCAAAVSLRIAGLLRFLALLLGLGFRV